MKESWQGNVPHERSSGANLDCAPELSSEDSVPCQPSLSILSASCRKKESRSDFSWKNPNIARFLGASEQELCASIAHILFGRPKKEQYWP